MPNKRLSQVNDLIRSELAIIINREIEFPENCLVTIKSVETSADLHLAKVWLSVLPFEEGPRVITILKKNIFFLQKILDQKLVMRYVPKLCFFIDQSEENAQKINTLLDNLKK